MTHLILETRDQNDKTVYIGRMSMTPPINDDYWRWRVRVSDGQAIVGFPKFSTVGIGFAKEDAERNTNLPYTEDAERLYNHIAKNKGDDAITTDDCIRAIRMIQDAINDIVTINWRTDPDGFARELAGGTDG